MSDTRVSPRANHRVAYFNGRIVPEREVVLPFRDRGFKYGDAAFDMTRTFHGRPFKLKEHVDRFYRSLRYLQIDPGLSPAVTGAANTRPGARHWWMVTFEPAGMRKRTNSSGAAPVCGNGGGTAWIIGPATRSTSSAQARSR